MTSRPSFPGVARPTAAAPSPSLREGRTLQRLPFPWSPAGSRVNRRFQHRLPASTRSLYFDIVQGRRFSAIGRPFDADFVSGFERNAEHYSDRRRRGVDLLSRQAIRSNPLIEKLAIHQKAEPRHPIVLVEIADANVMLACGAFKGGARGALRHRA